MASGEGALAFDFAFVAGELAVCTESDLLLVLSLGPEFLALPVALALTPEVLTGGPLSFGEVASLHSKRDVDSFVGFPVVTSPD